MADTQIKRPAVLCAVQDSPVAFDLEASLQRLATLTKEAAGRARKAAQDKWGPHVSPEILVVFPEAFLSAYPRGMDFGATIGSRTDAGRQWFRRYVDSSLHVSDVQGSQMTAVLDAAKSNGVTLVVGAIERCDGESTGPDRSTWGAPEKGGSGTLYCESKCDLRLEFALKWLEPPLVVFVAMLRQVLCSPFHPKASSCLAAASWRQPVANA